MSLRKEINKQKGMRPFCRANSPESAVILLSERKLRDIYDLD